MPPGANRRARGLLLSPDDEVAVAARAVVRFHMLSFARAEGAARAGEVEPTHQLRVATRRLRAALQLLAPVLPRGVADRMRREVSWLAGSIGAVRDLDVLGEVVASRARRLDPDVRGALGPLAIAIHERREAARGALIASLDSRRCRRLLDGLAQFCDASAPARRRATVGQVAPELFRPLLRSFLRAGRRVGQASPPEAFHRLRVRGKRLRYALETLDGLGGAAVTRMRRRLERLQDLLGEHQDAVTVVTWLRDWAARSGASLETVLATGALVQALSRRARRLRGRVPGAWARIDQTKLTGGVTTELARHAERTMPRRARAI